MPPVANGRAPNRSDRTPDSGPETRKPTVSGSMAMPAHSGVTREVVAVQRQPDPLQPDDQHEHQPAAAERGQQAGEDAGRERPDPEQLQRNIGSATLVSMKHEERCSSATPGPRQANTIGLVQPIVSAAVRLDPVGDADHDEDQPERRR